MTRDIFTKNLPVNIFEKHGIKFYGSDKYGALYKGTMTKPKTVDISLKAEQAHKYYKEIFSMLIGAS